MKFYTVGYYLIQLQPITFGSINSELVYTASTCINNSLLDYFSFSLYCENDEANKKNFEKFGINDQIQNEIHKWTENKLAEKKIGLPNIFFDIDIAKEYKNSFFADLDSIKIIGLYMPKDEINDMIDVFKPEGDNKSYYGISTKALEMVEEPETGIEIGYDLIGIESSEDFHSFHCHDMIDELKSKFDVEINKYFLIDSSKNYKAIIDYMNDEDSGCEPVPWYFAKIKLFD